MKLTRTRRPNATLEVSAICSAPHPYHYVWGVNYKNKFTDLLNDPKGMAKIQGEKIVNGLKTIKIDFKMADGDLDCQLWLLPEKNYLPLKFINFLTSDGSRVQETHYSEFKELSGGIWYPMNISLYYRHVEKPVTIKTEEIDNSPLTKEDFEFELPAFTHVTDHIIGTSYLTTEILDTSGIEDTPLAEKPLSNNEKEKVLDKYLESTKTTNSKDSDVTDTGVTLTPKGNLKEETTEVPYLKIMLAFIFVSLGIIFIFARRKKA